MAALLLGGTSGASRVERGGGGPGPPFSATLSLFGDGTPWYLDTGGCGIVHFTRKEGPDMANAIILVNAEPGKDRKVAQGLKKIKGGEGGYLVRGLYDLAATVRAGRSGERLETVDD